MWQILGHQNTLAYEAWPKFDPELAKDDLITLGVQVNGKTRGTIEIAPDETKENVLAQAKADQNVSKFLDGKTLVKEIYVPGRICNFVVK